MKVFYKQVQLNPTAETDYTDLVNKPSINGVELEGDLSTEQIKVTWHGTQEEFDALPSHDPYTFYIIDDGTPVGTQDSYLDLADKPSINGQILTGNKLPSDLDMYSRPDVDNLLASMRSIKVVATKPAAPAANTMYYVGPDSESNYHVYLYDALLNEIDLGMAMNQLYREGTAIDIDSANTISVKVDDDTIKTNLSNELYVPELMGSEGSGINPIYLADNKLKASTSTVGQVNIPVYLNNGKINVVNSWSSTGDHTTFVPFVDGGGLMQTGQTFQMHLPNSNANDWANLALDQTDKSVILWNNNYENKQKGAILTTNGDTMKNELYASFPAASSGSTQKMVMNGSYAATSSNLLDLVEELRFSSGASGSVNLTSSYTCTNTGVTVPNSWYNYLYVPHRTGGANGGSVGDNVRFGSLWLGIWSSYGNLYRVGLQATSGTTIDASMINVIRYADSNYINQYVPFCISHSGSGKVGTKNFTDISGKTYQIWSTSGRAIYIGGSGIANATTVKCSITEQVGSSLSGSIKLRNLAVTQIVYVRAYGVSTGTTPMYFNVSGAATDGNYSFSPFGNVNFGGVYTLNITWNRLGAGGNWWRGTGSISLPDTTTTNSRMCDIDIWCQASAADVLPCLEFGSNVTGGDHTFTFEIYPKSW